MASDKEGISYISIAFQFHSHSVFIMVLDGLVVSMMGCLAIMTFGVQIPARAEIWFELSATSAPLADMSTLKLKTI